MLLLHTLLNDPNHNFSERHFAYDNVTLRVVPPFKQSDWTFKFENCLENEDTSMHEDIFLNKSFIVARILLEFLKVPFSVLHSLTTNLCFSLPLRSALEVTRTQIDGIRIGFASRK